MDRNTELYKALSHVRWSLSARRAWIEIETCSSVLKTAYVALRKESVDRNLVRSSNRAVNIGRSPQGERG